MSNILSFKMLKLLGEKVIFKHKLNTALEKLLSEGFTFYNGCYFLKSLQKLQSHVKESDFDDLTEYECFINSIHIDDYVDNDILEQALLFSFNLIKKWNVHNDGLTLNLILIETDFGFNLKFHFYRENENWINENDIDKFEEAIMIFKSR